MSADLQASLAAPPAPRSLHAVGVCDIAGLGCELWTDQPLALATFIATHRHFRVAGAVEALQVQVLAGGARSGAPRIRFPSLDPAALRRLIERGTAGRFEFLRAIGTEPRLLYRDRLLDLNPAIELGPNGCDVLEPRLLCPYLELLLLNGALERAPHITAAHAAVVAFGDRAALICGDGGAGKTTLTLALLRLGCTYLSDEVALIDRASRRVRAYPRSLGVREGTIALLGDRTLAPGAFQAVSVTGDTKWFTDPGTAAPAGIRSDARLEHLWFLRGRGPEPRLACLDPWEAAQGLARSLRHVRGSGIQQLWTAVEVADRCRSYEVIAGSPTATAAALVQLLEKKGEALML